jgi:hypothetical protein
MTHNLGNLKAVGRYSAATIFLALEWHFIPPIRPSLPSPSPDLPRIFAAFFLGRLVNDLAGRVVAPALVVRHRHGVLSQVLGSRIVLLSPPALSGAHHGCP